MTLENITRPLSQAYKQCVPGTVLCADQLTKERQTNNQLRSQWFYTADGCVYSVDNGMPTLHLTREATNPVLKHLEDAINSSYDQLTTYGFYNVLPTDFKAVTSAVDTVTIDLAKLTFQKYNDEIGYVAISTTKYDQLNSEDRKLAQRVYGSGNDFIENMNLLYTIGIAETKIYLLNPMYVKEHVKELPIAMASCLSELGVVSDFDMAVRNVNLDNNIRAERKQ